MRYALEYHRHSEKIWEHRAAVITKAVGDAFE